jgi:hypothetical protein
VSEEKTGQPTGAASATPAEPTGLKGVWEGDFFQKGMEKLDEVEVQGAKKSDDDCPGCDKEKRAREAEAKGTAEKKPPYAIIKVDGRDYAVESEAEMRELASKGMNYTRKTQALADEKRSVEKLPVDLQASIKRFDELAARLESGLATGTRAAASAKIEEPPAKDVSLEEEFGYEPDIVDPHVPKMAAMLRTTNKKLALLEESNKLFFLDKVVNTINGTISQAVKTFPIENIKDENGKSVTWDQFVGTFKNMLEDPANNKKSIPEMATEAVRMVHLSQKTLRERTAEEAKSDAVSDDIPLDELRAKHPKLFERISDQAVAEHAAKAGELPPSPKSRGTEATAQKVERHPAEGRKLRDRLDDAFNDPEVIAGFNPQ